MIAPHDSSERDSREDELRRADLAFHEATAHLYDGVLMPIFGVYYPLVVLPKLDALAQAAPGRDALDIGCGTAGITVELARRGFDVQGLDHSPAMLAVAEQKVQARGLAERVTLLTGDVGRLPFEDASFDIVTCQGVLHHLPAPDQAVREMARVLRPGGVFFISEPVEGSTPTHWLWEGARRVLWRLREKRRRGSPVTEPVPLDIPDHEEGPMDASELLGVLARHALVSHHEYWVHFEGAHRLPTPLTKAVIQWLSRPWRHRRGNLLYVTGYKRN